MKILIPILILSFSQTLHAEEVLPDFENKIYTPAVVVDPSNEGAKGAVQLLWEKSADNTRYELEVSNGKTIYSAVGEKHFQHIMLYFDKDYQWRVREVSARKSTEFTPWIPLRVVKGKELAQQDIYREPVSVEAPKREVDEYVLDAGEN